MAAKKTKAKVKKIDLMNSPLEAIGPYKPKRGEAYMCDAQLDYFKTLLTQWKENLINEVDRTVVHMKDEASNFPDPNDRATQESEFGLELRTRDRERKLLKKITSTLSRIDDGDYGYCEETGEEIPCELVGLTAGVSPNVDFLRNTELEIDKGILVNAYLETNIDFVYAVGDCVQFKNPAPGRRAIEPVWYTGRMMGECLGQTLSELRKAYKPGVWFNSAKFFDIEYQTYGTVNANPQEHEGVFHWEHKSGKKSLYIVYDKKSQQVIGVNAFGIRLRHHVMDYIIRNKHTIQYLIEHLRDVNFDPEFYKNHSKEIAKAYETQFHTKVRLKYKNWFRIMKATKESILQ